MRGYGDHPFQTVLLVALVFCIGAVQLVPISAQIPTPDPKVLPLCQALTHFANGATSASLSLNGKQIAFVGSNDIFTMNPDGSNQHNLTNDGRSHLFPTWSPDGKRIAYLTT